MKISTRIAISTILISVCFIVAMTILLGVYAQSSQTAQTQIEDTEPALRDLQHLSGIIEDQAGN